MTAAARHQELYSAHLCALHMLVNLGWHFLTTAEALALRGNSTREVILKPRLIEVLQSRRFVYKGESFPLSPSGIDQIVRQVQALRLGEGLLPANERLYQMLTLGITVTEFMPDGRKHQPTIALINWHDAADNRWDVTEALQVLSTHGTHHRCPDVVAFVNGLPLVVIEAKCADTARSGNAMLHEGISQQLRNQRPGEIAQLFAYAQLLLSVSATEGRYGTTQTPLKFWAQWREEAFAQEQLSEWKNRPLPPDAAAALLRGKPEALQAHCRALWAQPLLPTEQDVLLAALLQPERLLEFLRLFVLFDRKLGKLVARHQQFFGIRALLARIRQRRPDGAREGGVLWHSTGSGKSFTMLFLTKALVLHPGTQACRVLVVTDRLDLEEQLSRNFISGGAFGSALATRKDGERARASTGRELARRIGQGTERIVFTLVHKFATASKLPDCYNPSADIVVLVDEGHRSHDGELHERMRQALPRAAYVAFTGTPLLKDDKTANKFGPIVHAYSMQRAVDDGTVVPLLYEERVPELTINEAAVNRWFERITAGLSAQQAADLKRRLTTQRVVFGAAHRIELIAWDIAQHFSQNIKALGLGLKGQVATASKLDAIRYQQCLDDTGLVSSAIVMSPPDSREGNTEVDEGTIPEVQRWWNAHVGRNADGYEEDVLQAFGHDGAPDLLIVVDRLLTGFDEPRNSVLYIDKPLRAHGLIQAVARVNRLHAAKQHGLLVDYRGSLKSLDTTVLAYRDLESRTQGGFELTDIAALYPPWRAEYQRLPRLHRALRAVFDGTPDPCDLQSYRRWLPPRLDAFEEALARFRACLQTALASRSFHEDPEVGASTVEAYQTDLQFFSALQRIARRDAQMAAAPARRPTRRSAAALAVHEPGAPYRPPPRQPVSAPPAPRPYADVMASVIPREHALRLDEAVRAALAEHTLHPQNAAAAVRQVLLPPLFALLGLERARTLTELVVQATRTARV
jgi:type I restriction enzyme R subunit